MRQTQFLYSGGEKVAMKRAVISLLLFTCITSLVLTPGLAGQTSKGTAPARRPSSLQQSDVWPRAYSLPSEAQMVIFQPQASSWENQKHLVALAAVSYTKKDAPKPDLGTIKLETDTSVALQERLVKFTAPKVTETNFQTLSKDQAQEIVAEIEKLIPDDERTISLDRVLAQVDKSTITAKNVEGLKADPPLVFYSRTPAILLNFDGDPIWSPIKDNELKFAVNTNWDVLEYPGTKTYYLRDDASWLKATNLNGPWTPAGKLPESFRKLPGDDNWKDVVLNLPGKPITKAPHVFYSTKPSEMILLEGEPKYEPVPNTSLLWISNTESDLFRAGENGPFYYLVAGRWFTAPNLNSSWNFATPNLPEDFKKISPEHPRSRVLASVPGTDQAAEAVLLAQVPQIARVNKKEIKAPEVIYQGEPQFELIPGTQLQRAVNTDKEIIKAGDAYYMCYEGVWFMASGPAGEWHVATSIPPEIYQIPPSSPAYDVTYVTIEKDEDENDDWVTYAATAGYTGMMIGWGCAMWGTGWYYPPYYWYGGYYPIYYPYWRTYGYGAWYNPYTGVYGTAGRIYGPYGGAGFGARYNPSTGTYARGAFAYGPYGARGAAQAYNPRTGTALQTRQGSGVYGSWGSTQVKRGDDWASTKRFTNSAGNTTRVTRGSNGGTLVNRRGEGFVGKQGDNIYAGRDGNAYRRDANGNWSKWENGGWNPAQKPEGANSVRDNMMNDKARQRERQNPTRGDGASGDRAGSSARAGQLDTSTYRGLERDRGGRADGAQRMRDQQTFQNRTQSRPSNMGSYRGGGGMSRGGGGFRGGGGRRR
jgi:hypothetical protein